MRAKFYGKEGPAKCAITYKLQTLECFEHTRKHNLKGHSDEDYQRHLKFKTAKIKSIEALDE